jgi:hypothetical protein
MIKATDFVPEEAKQAAQAEALSALLDTFAKEIGAGIFAKMQEGPIKWDDIQLDEEIRRNLLTNFKNDDMVGVAMNAMFLWNFKSK